MGKKRPPINDDLLRSTMDEFGIGAASDTKAPALPEPAVVDTEPARERPVRPAPAPAPRAAAQRPVTSLAVATERRPVTSRPVRASKEQHNFMLPPDLSEDVRNAAAYLKDAVGPWMSQNLLAEQALRAYLDRLADEHGLDRWPQRP